MIAAEVRRFLLANNKESILSWMREDLTDTQNVPVLPEGRSLEKSTLFVATVTSFMGPFMISSVNVALPVIQAEFKISAVLLSWVATSYLLATAVFLVPIGKIADIYGRKKIFTSGLILFVATTSFLIFTDSIAMLIALRTLQGLGGAMIVTTGMAIVTSVFPPARRGRAIGIYVAAVYVGLSAGPTVGGMLTFHFGWRSIFLAVIPFGALSIFISFRHLRTEWRGNPDEKFDWFGSILYGASLVALVYGASLLPVSAAYIMVGSGAAGFVFFVFYQRSISFPVFEVRLFQQNRVFAFSSLAALINYAATYATTFMMSLYLQYVKGFNPQTAGLILVCQPVMMALFSPVAGKLSDKVEPRKIASAGMFLTAAGLLQFVFLGEGSSVFYVAGVLVLLGFGFALFSSPNMNAIMGAVDQRYFGIASGAVATMRVLGQMMSMAAATVVFAIILGSRPLTSSDLDLFMVSLKTVFTIFTILCAIGIFFSLTRGELRANKRL
jgi:EmrB/QacA subfamily drug resistance transporter